MLAFNQPSSVSFSSRHFRVEKLSDGVYAAIHSEGGWAIGNAGIIDLGDKTLVFDAFHTPQAAKDLVKACLYLTGHPVKLLINSHYHNDHTWGNQAFGAEVDIISTAKTRSLIITEGLAQVKAYTDTAQNELEGLQDRLDHSRDEAECHDLQLFIDEYHGIIASLPILKLRLPNLTFTGEMTMHGSKRSVSIMTYEGGHSESDTLLYLPEDRIIFMGDTLFINSHPYLADGDPDVTLRILAEVKLLKPSTVVPGHGPCGKIEHLDLLDGYIHHLLAMVGNAIHRGATEDELASTPIPQKYRAWSFQPFFTSNLRFLYRRKVGPEGS